MPNRNYKNYSIARDDAGVFRVVLDVPGRPLNILNQDAMSELESIIDEIEQDKLIRLVVFKSGKESGFLAGADVQVIQSITTPREADEMLLRGQRLFDRIERLQVPTLAVIHGPCLGGGLEMALACDYRISRDNSSTKIGLPEIRLGLIPGWGGTQRLTGRVGLRHSLSMILSGKHLTSDEAFRIGLVDCSIAPDCWRDGVGQAVATLVGGGSIRRRGGLLERMSRMILWSSAVKNLVIWLTRNRLEHKAMHYPALDAAMTAISDSFDANVDGYATERREFGDLIETPTCRELLKLFFSRERARSLKTWSPESARAIHRVPIRKLGVVGAGAMGASIAQAAATRGYQVCLKEIDRLAVQSGNERIDRMVNQYSRHKRWSDKDRLELRSRINVSSDWGAFADADCVIEAVVERMDVKEQVLSEVERQIGNAAILATNTSALSVSEMADALACPTRFAGLHFFNPVHRMELVEVVRGSKTSDATIAKLVSFVRALGKTPVVTSDSPGFLVNRVLFPYLGEAVLMVRQGYDIAEIDREVKRFGMPMGPLELLDRVGLDVALHVAQTLRTVLVDVDDVIAVLAPLVKRGEVGTKSKRGFYDYRGKRRSVRPGSEIVDFLVESPTATDFVPDGFTSIQRRLIYPMLVEAIRCEQEGVVEFPWAIDLAMVLGTGFAPHRGGPLSVVDEIGAATIVSNLDRLREQFGDRFAAPDRLTECGQTGERLV